MKKFALVGSHSTGKTTLLEKLKDLYPEMHFTHSVTRSITSDKERKLEDITDDTQQRVLEGIKEKEKELVEIGKEKNIFMDRSYLDFAAYSEAFYKRDLISYDLLAEIVKGCDQRLEDKDPYSYDILFYLPIEFEISDDGIRNTDSELQSEVDLIIQDLLIVAKEQFDVKIVHITGPIEERIKKIQDALRVSGI